MALTLILIGLVSSQLYTSLGSASDQVALQGGNAIGINSTVVLLTVSPSFTPVANPDSRRKFEEGGQSQEQDSQNEGQTQGHDSNEDVQAADHDSGMQEQGPVTPAKSLLAAIIIPVVLGILLIVAIILGVLLYKRFSNPPQKKSLETFTKNPIPKAEENIYAENPGYINIASFPIEKS